MLRFAKHFLRRALARLGYRITKLPASLPPGEARLRGGYASHARLSMDGLLGALAARSLGIRTVIDIGASNGDWTERALAHFPNCQYLLIEAQLVHERDLQAFCRKHPQAQYVLAAAGAAPGQLYFDASDPVGGQASQVPYAHNNLVVPVTTVDAEVERLGLPGPYLLKLDTHGFEPPILQGAQRTLPAVAALLMECYNFRIAPECLLFDEMSVHLRTLGFHCVDLGDIMHRPHDEALWQMDMAFIRDDPAVFGYLGYS
jgi:FkbM family methyltransferase